MFTLSRRAFLLSGVVLVAACGGENDTGQVGPPAPPPPPPPPPGQVSFNFSFANGLDNWEPNYADYTLGQEPTIDFTFGFQRVPPNLPNVSGLLMSSFNVSDDVFMYITRLVEGLSPNTRYRVDISVGIATNVPPNCPGAGGSPGEGVAIKAGATNVAPAKVVGPNSFVTVNFDKGAQSQSGVNAVVIGNFAQDQVGGSCLNGVYLRKNLASGTSGPLVNADANGRLWLIIGTDSGFEGLTRIFYLDGTAILTPA